MKFLIISDYPYVIEKSGYGNQIEFILNYLIDYFPENEYFFIPIGTNLNECDIINPDYFENLDITKKKYFEKVKIFGIENSINLFNNLLKFQEKFNFDENDKILFYCDLIYFEKYKYFNIKAKKYYWFPCHTTFNDNYEKFDINLQKIKENDNNILNILPIFDKISTFSKFGMSVLESINYNSTFINHCIDKNKFKKHNKNNLRDLLNIERDSFICLIIGRNNDEYDRKAFRENILGFKLFCDYLKKDNLYLLIHPIIYDNYVNLYKIFKEFNIEDKIIKIDSNLFKLTDFNINQLYNVSDVLLCNSKMEGFGLTSVEAQFCELPVIVTDCSGLTDNVFYGFKTTPKFSTNKINNINSYSIPDPEEICKSIIKVYNDDLQKINIPKNLYDINFIFKDWINFLELQNNSNIINLGNEKILFVLLNDFNLLNNIKNINYFYPNCNIILINKNNEKIYNDILNLKIPNIKILKIKNNFYFTILKEIFLKTQFFKYYFFVENILINKNIKIINKKIYYSFNSIKNTITDSKEINNLGYKDLINNLILSKNINLFTNNLLISCENFYNLIKYFNKFEENNIYFKIIFSIYLANQNSDNLNTLIN